MRLEWTSRTCAPLAIVVFQARRDLVREEAALSIEFYASDELAVSMASFST